jgi:hypothetical protein
MHPTKNGEINMATPDLNTKPKTKGWISNLNDKLESAVGPKWAAGIRIAVTTALAIPVVPFVLAHPYLTLALAGSVGAVRKYQHKPAFKPFVDFFKSTAKSVGILIGVVKPYAQKLDSTLDKGASQDSTKSHNLSSSGALGKTFGNAQTPKAGNDNASKPSQNHNQQYKM